MPQPAVSEVRGEGEIDHKLCFAYFCMEACACVCSQTYALTHASYEHTRAHIHHRSEHTPTQNA